MGLPQDGTDIRFVAPNHAQTLMGKALHAACANSRVTDRFQESLYLVLELLRAGVVHGQRWSKDEEPLSGGPSGGSDEDQMCVMLIMRVLSALPLNSRVSVLRGTADNSPNNGLDHSPASCSSSTRLSAL